MKSILPFVLFCISAAAELKCEDRLVYSEHIQAALKMAKESDLREQKSGESELRIILECGAEGVYIVVVHLAEPGGTIRWSHVVVGLQKLSDISAVPLRIDQRSRRTLKAVQAYNVREMFKIGKFLERPPFLPSKPGFDGICLGIEAMLGGKYHKIDRSALFQPPPPNTVLPLEETSVLAAVYYIFGLIDVDVPLL